MIPIYNPFMVSKTKTKESYNYKYAKNTTHERKETKTHVCVLIIYNVDGDGIWVLEQISTKRIAINTT